LQIVIDVARGLVVYPKTIEAAVKAELPFMATEEILMAAVRRGGDRQALHEVIRKHSIDAAQQVKQHGLPNDLIERLRKEPAFSGIQWDKVLDPAEFTGRSSVQVTRFIADVVEPIRKKYRAQLDEAFTLRV
jgi:adenylosuccinate lyase